MDRVGTDRSDSPEDLRSRVQQVLGDGYALERDLGGGMARVFVAEDTTLGRRVVVKVLPPELSGAVSAERFRREVQVAARLQHPHIVPLLSAGEGGGLLYYTMPYVAGETLRTRLTRDGALSLRTAVALVRDVARALAHAHRYGVVHRDIKPENVLLGEDGDALVADFGIAKALAAATQADAAGRLAGEPLTSVGFSLGTPAYMAPEQALGDPSADQRTDLYALGVVAYEALAGSHPFAGRPVHALLAAHATEPPEPLSRRRPSVPPALSALVMHLLEKHPADRPESADAVLQALDEVATPSAATPRSLPNAGGAAPTPVAHGRRVAPLVGGAARLLVLAGGAALYRGMREPEPAALRSVAVVPFENLGDAADVYFADGVTEEIASRLARVPGIIVLGRASALGLRGTGKSPEEVGQALGAAYVLRGTVRWARAAAGAPGRTDSGGAMVRIVPALVNVASGAEVWGEPYQAPLIDVFRVQAEVAEHVAMALEATLGGSTSPRGGPMTLASRGGPTDRVAPAAFDAYLLGRHYWRKRGLGNLRRATDEFRRAIALDSGFARAWAGFAATYSILANYGDTTLTAAEARREAEPAARRAIALAPDDAQGYIALASALQNDYEFRGALAALDQALARDSSDATAHQWRAEVLQALGRLPEAEAAGRRAVALDPLSAVINQALAWVMVASRRHDEAIRLFRRAVELEPERPDLRAALLTAYAETGRQAEAEAQLAAAGFPGRLALEMLRGVMDPRAADRGRAALRTWRATVPDRGRYGLLAWMYAGFREADSTLVMMRRGAEERHAIIPVLLDDPFLDFLHDDPRWVELVEDIRGR